MRSKRRCERWRDVGTSGGWKGAELHGQAPLERSSEEQVKLGIAADHAGTELRDAIRTHLVSQGHEVREYGGPNDPDDDYPLIVALLADAVARGEVERGIFCCGSGIGPAVAANKIAGVRAAVVTEEWSARDAVEHVDVNLLTLGQRVVGVELAKSIVDSYLGAQLQGGRHARRREQISALEKRPAPFAADRSLPGGMPDQKGARRSGTEVRR